MPFDNSSDLIVAIQGGMGAFHHVAAQHYFTRMQRAFHLLPCETFTDVFTAVVAGRANLAMVAIENSLAGSLLCNYPLIQNSGLRIIGELPLHITQNLMALPGQQLADIREIRSHPVALLQCRAFLEPLRQQGVRLVEAADTALSAADIAQNQQKGIAALASTLAAKLYDLEIIAPHVQDHALNYTRFLVLAPQSFPWNPIWVSNKATICFSLPHKVGSLAKVLDCFAFYQVNLSMIQSVPIVGKPWEYFFYADIVFDHLEQYQTALQSVKALTDHFSLLGCYPEWKD